MRLQKFLIFYIETAPTFALAGGFLGLTMTEYKYRKNPKPYHNEYLLFSGVRGAFAGFFWPATAVLVPTYYLLNEMKKD